MKYTKKTLLEKIAEWMVESTYRRIDHAFVDGHIAENYWGF